MKSKSSSESVTKLHDSSKLNLPDFLNDKNKVLTKEEIFNVEGTNVIRVPFGTIQPKKKRPEKINSWPTLILTLNTIDCPNPPPHAA
tara:strand:+ start:61 stop:321 length:261 start_codon:yes stop_codon:yes gene_type:complete